MAVLIPEIIFEDQHLIVLSKPAGLLSQGEHTGDENVVDWLRQYFGRNYVGLVHRLDRNTSGAMVVAKRTKSAQRLTDALQKGELQRTYLAWLSGVLREPARWQHSLLKDEKSNLVRVVTPSHPQGKKALLTVRPIRTGFYEKQPVTLAEFVLETGRSHQIRVQAAQEDHPLLGDTKYATSKSVQPVSLFGRPALHSNLIRFPHPMSGEMLTFEAPLPADMLSVSPSGG